MPFLHDWQARKGVQERGLQAAGQVGQRVPPDPLTKDPAQAVALRWKDRRDALSYDRSLRRLDSARVLLAHDCDYELELKSSPGHLTNRAG